MYLITTSSKGISALKLAGWLGVSHKTAWHVGHRIRAMMASEPILLEGIVELDETDVGGKPRKVHCERLLPKGQRPQRKRGRAYVGHHRVRHSDDEFTRTDGEFRVHVNTAESFNAMLKRGIIGVFHDTLTA